MWRLAAVIKSILTELESALSNLTATGETHTIYINKMGLSQKDREELHDYLGQGSVSIKLKNSDEPAEWIESGISGIWLGVYFDHRDNPLLETVEVAYFPPVAAAHKEDILQGRQRLQSLIADYQ